MYGFYIRKGIGRRFGPEVSIKKSVIKNLLKKHNFVINNSYGINLIPSFASLLQLGLSKKFDYLKSILRVWSRINILEGMTMKYFFKSFCNKYIYILSNEIDTK